MTLLWVSIALMTALMLLFFILPLHFARSRDESVDLSSLNKQVFNEHLSQLEKDFSEGLIDNNDYEAQKRELEDRFLLDMDGVAENSTEDGGASKKGSKANLIGLLAAGLIASAASVALYYDLGATEELEMAKNLESVSGLSEQELLTRLEQQLDAEPESLEGQLLLARTYLTLGRSADAVKPLTKALELTKGTDAEASVLAQLAQATYFTNPSVITEQAETYIEQSLQLNPQEPTALGVSGIFAFEKGDYQKAVDQWQKVLAVIDEGPNAASLRKGIETAKIRMAEANGGQPDASQAEAQAASSKAIQVAVGITEEVKKDFASNTRVFVYARHAQGPRMPLAIQSVTVADLPVALTLDDTTSMAGMAKLSDAQNVQVIARISVSGSAMPSEGDVQVTSKPVSMDAIPENIALELSY